MKIHFIAVGGAIMHNLAICLQELGHMITGSDDVIFDPSKSNLLKFDLLPEKIGFYKENVTEDLDAVILGMHAKKDNVELKEALNKNIKVYSFPEFIYKQSKNKKRVVIAGSHGKTTTTAMVMHVLKSLNMDFDYLVGASLEGFERGVKLSNAPLIILEGDEYLSSPIEMRSKFHYYDADVALITGIAWDHINVFPTLDSYHDTFKEFIQNLRKESVLILFEEDKVLQSLSKNAKCISQNYGTPSYEINNGITILKYQDVNYELSIFGKHNLQNLEGARKICESLEISAQKFYASIASFKGTARRLEKISNKNNFAAFKDFAHSPSKLEATIKAVKIQFPDKQLIACMELHTYSSTNPTFLKEFRDSMNPADDAILYMSDSAFKIKNRARIPDEIIWENFNNANISIYRRSKDLKNHIEKLNLSNSVLLLMSSGSFDGLDWLKILNNDN